MLTLHNLKPSKNSQKRSKRVGRGNASGKGTYSARGMKGQRSRSGGKSGLKLKGLKQNLLNIPKIRGFNSPNKPKLEVSLTQLDTVCTDGDVVTPTFLKEKGVVKTVRYGIKILGNGSIKKKITVDGCGITQSAKELVEKAGGTVKVVEGSK